MNKTWRQTLTCDHDPRQARHGLAARDHAPHVAEVLGLDAVVAVHLAGVQQAAQTQAVQTDGQDVAEI